MKNKFYFIKYAFIVILAASITGCNLILPLEIKEIEKISIKQMSFSYLDVEIQLPVINPNSFAFKITKINLDASINGLHVGTITENQIIPIKANSEEIITVPLRVQTKDLLSGALNLFLNYSGKNSSMKLNGTIEIKIWIFHKTIEVNQETRMLRSKTN